MSKSSVIWIVLGIILALAIGYGIAQIVDKTQEHLYNFSVTVWAPGDFACILSATELEGVKGEKLNLTITNSVSGGYDCQIFYAVNGLPADAVSFSVNPVKPNEASVLTIDTSKLDSQTTYTCTLIARADKPVTN